MKIHLVNFATTSEDKDYPDHSKMQHLQNQSARNWGINSVISWTRQHLIQTPFYAENQFILDQKRGAGYWLWKPFIILETLKSIENDDVVLYLDSDIRITADPKPLVDICRQNRGFFLVELREMDRVNRMWTKRDCFYFMDLDTSYYHDAPHTPSGLQIYQKNAATMSFLEELLHYSKDRYIITDEPNICGKPNLEGFVEHRHDQSILTLLKLKYNIEGFRWPSQWGNHGKIVEYRIKGEFLAKAYSETPYGNSPYGTLLSDMGLEEDIFSLPSLSKREGFTYLNQTYSRLKDRISIVMNKHRVGNR